MSSNEKRSTTGFIGYQLKQTQHILRLHMDEALRSLDLTTPQYAVLAQLGLRPGISNAALARYAYITAQTMHGIITNLENRNLIKRKNDPHNRRILRSELTKQGINILTHAHEIVCSVESGMTATMSEDKKVLLSKLLLECFNNLNHGGIR